MQLGWFVYGVERMTKKCNCSHHKVIEELVYHHQCPFCIAYVEA
jgi:hypothetical protein